MDDFNNAFEKARDQLYAENPGLEFICCTSANDTQRVADEYGVKTYKAGDNEYYLIPLTAEIQRDFVDSESPAVFENLGLDEESFEW